jgi:vinculin
MELCSSIEQDTTELTHLCRECRGSSARAMALAKKIAINLDELKYAIQTALVDKVVQDFLDIGTPLKQFTDCVLTPTLTGADRDRQFEEKASNLSIFSDKLVRTGKMVAVGTGTANKKVAEAILTVSGQMESLTPQLINAGRIRMVIIKYKAKKWKIQKYFKNVFF